MLENECSADMKFFIYLTGAQHQLVPPGLHCALIDKRYIKSFKHHFISGLSSCNPKFPLNLGCCLIQQAVPTLNRLIPDKLDSCLSAKYFFNRVLHFNQTPLAPPGIKVLIFEVPGNRRTFAQHGLEGWHCDPSQEHYQCYNVYVP